MYYFFMISSGLTP